MINLFERLWGEKSLEDIARRCQKRNATLSKAAGNERVCYTWMEEKFCKYQGELVPLIEEKRAGVYFKCNYKKCL